MILRNISEILKEKCTPGMSFMVLFFDFSISAVFISEVKILLEINDIMFFEKELITDT